MTLNVIPLTESTFQLRMLTFFLEKAVQSPVFYSLLQVYVVYRVSFILVSVCTKGFAYLLCWPRERGVCTRRFSCHEFYSFFPFNFNFIFLEYFFTHDIYRHPHPRLTPTTHDPRPLPTSHDLRHLATLPPEGMPSPPYFKEACVFPWLFTIYIGKPVGSRFG